MWFDLPDLRPLFALAAVGALALAVGAGWGLWWLVHHVSIR